MRPPRDPSLQKKLLESDWLEAVVNSLCNNPRHRKTNQKCCAVEGKYAGAPHLLLFAKGFVTLWHEQGSSICCL